MKTLLGIIVAGALIFGGWYLLSDNDNNEVALSPTPTATATPTSSATPTASPSGTVSPSGSRTPTPSPSATPFTSTNVKVTSPLPNSTIKSPLTITGQARGSWFFEAVFPVKLLDGNGKVIATGQAQAQGDWQTTNFVPFKVNLTFTKPSTATGTLVFEKDNPSGLPQNDQSVSFKIKF
ncbi:MAG: Gmad2 immunoglobulin-like domain-containing protein [Candidatus Yanofskybacteria bacterium]|nr:Gmad2 immunoglobulin-like domain-containing protein [Candidatus Yanofskybacteria bacterium]